MPASADPATDPPDRLLERFVTLQAAGDLAGALTLIERLVALLPDNARIHGYHAFTLERLGRSEDALGGYARALALEPGFVDARYNRACLLARLAEPAAEAAFAELLAVAPGHDGARAALGMLRAQRLQPRFEAARTLEQAGDRAGAEAVYRALLDELPDNVPVLHNLAALVAPRDPADAIALWQHALALEPANLDVRAALGQFLFQQDRVAAALPHLEAVVARAPDHTAIAELVQARANLCAWPELAALTPRLAAAIRGGTPAIPLAAVRFGDDDPELTLLAGRRFMRHVLDHAFPGGVAPRTHARPRAAPERLAVGYLSSDLRGHIIGLLLAAVLERHDRARFAVHAYQLGRQNDATTDRIRAAVAGFTDVSSLSLPQIADRIAADRLDLVIEMNGWTRDGRSEALAPRPAPVQLQWLGYPGTSGGDFIDYVIADDFTVPPGAERWFTERILRLPHTHQPFDLALTPLATPARDALGLPDDGLVLASLVPYWKITPAVFDVWMRVLSDQPDAMLWLGDGRGDARRTLAAEAASRGVARERLVFARRMPMPEFLAALPAADLFVDTFPYGGHSTATGALFAGLPVVTAVGRTFASRVAGSVLRAAGLEALVAPDLGAYEELLRGLGRDRAALARWRTTLAARRAVAPLFDLDGFVRALERGYVAAWERWRAGAPASDIAVPES
jgi:predicted O-linked N-acetylglucosamine transferase (SPINDLY family)